MNSPPPPLPSRWPRLLLILATSLGVPGAMLAFFAEEIRKHPWITLALLLVYEGLVLAGGFAANLWQSLQSRWVDHLAEEIDRNLRMRLSRCSRRYLEWVYFQHRDFDVKGLSTQGTYNLELEQVFVDLAIEPTPPHAASTDLIRPVPEKLSGRRKIWDYLESKELLGHNLVLLGPPGSGKTTLLKKIALELSRRRSRRRRQGIPVLLFLREHSEAIGRKFSYPLPAAIRASLAHHQGPPIPEGWLETRLAAGRCLLLLDGLDEVATAEGRRAVIEWVESQMMAYPRNRFLLSARPYGYRANPLVNATVLEVQPFSREQVRSFIHNWYRANEIRAAGKLDPGVGMAAREGAEDLLRRLGRAPTLSALSVNPLLLTMIATVHRFRSSLPGRRVELYAEICEVFLGKRREARGLTSELTPAQKQRVLQPLAFSLMQQARREILRDEAMQVIAEPLRRVTGRSGPEAEASFLKEIEDGSGLLLERQADHWVFAHLVFQEYLAAVHAREQGLGNDLAARITDPWWHEVLRLYGAQADASPILAACLSLNHPSVSILSLAIDCLEEAREVEPKWRDRLSTLIARGVEDQDPERFRLAAETFLARRLRNLPILDETPCIDPGYITNSEYQVFLDELRASGQYRQPDHWSSLRFPAGKALSPVVGIRHSDAHKFADWLAGRDPAYRFRLPKPDELSAQQPKLSESPQSVRGCWTSSDSIFFENPEGAAERAPSTDYFRKKLADDLGRTIDDLIPSLGRSNVHWLIDQLSSQRDLALARFLTLFVTLNLDMESYSNLHSSLDGKLSRAKTIESNINRFIEEGFGAACTPFFDFERAIASLSACGMRHDQNLTIFLERILDRDPRGDLGRARARARRLALAEVFSISWNHSRPRRDYPDTGTQKHLFSLYLSIVTLDGRSRGELGVFEGLRIVKTTERDEKSASSTSG